MALVNRVKCTYPDCMKTFPNEKEMRRHKINAPEHEYCSRCDADCADFVHLLKHKAKSRRHIACAICGEDFRSGSGREMHVKQVHNSKRKVNCPACEREFPNAAVLMAHIEEDDCEFLSVHEYKAHRVQQKVDQKAIGIAKAESEEASSRRGATTVPGNSWSTETPTGSGGVNITKNWLENGPEPKPVDPPQTSNEAIERAIQRMKLESENNGSHKIKAWPALITSPELKSKENTAPEVPNDPPLEDLMQFTQVSGVTGRQTHVPAAPSVISNTTGSYANRWAKWRTVEEGGNTAPGDSPIARMTGGHLFDASRFYNPLLKEYVCACDKPFRTAHDLEAHIASGVHNSGAVRCPSCVRVFKSNAALIAHMESPSRRCNIRSSRLYPKYMYEASGGVIRLPGFDQTEEVNKESETETLEKKEQAEDAPAEVQW